MRTEPRTENLSNPTDGLSRLYLFLANCNHFPVGLKAAESFSKVPEEEIRNIFKHPVHYAVKGGEIYRCQDGNCLSSR